MRGLRLTHIGGPTLLIEHAGWAVLVDPTFDPPGRRYAFGWGTSSRKLTGPALQPADLPPLDAVLLSHDHHADNLDDAGRALLPSVPVVVTTGPGAGRLGHGARGLHPWQMTELEAAGKPTLEVTATPARHGPPLSRPVAGAVIGFALRGQVRPAERCGSPGTACCSAACMRSPSGCAWTPRCSTWAASGSRSRARCATR